jgi:23S rRNA (uridine2552-2'-O)-methyltransferase
MAANTTGDQNTDHLRIIGLLEEALNLSQKILKNQGCFVGKIFQGGSSKEILNLLQQNFMTVKYFKPESSRKDSSETYLVASGFKGHEPEKIKITI